MTLRDGRDARNAHLHAFIMKFNSACFPAPVNMALTNPFSQAIDLAQNNLGA